jgi:beta-lactamase superfamily II metal-dependent hydrolase
MKAGWQDMLQRKIWILAGACLLLPCGAKAADKPQASKAQAAKPSATKDLRIVTVDVEGGAAVLFVTPEGKSLLIDTGWPPGMGGPRPMPGAPPAPPMPSSAERIAAAAASLGVTKIDYLLMTHYHVDHLGGLQALLAKLPVGTFIDHGPNREDLAANANPRQATMAPATLYPGWVAAYAGHGHITAEVGKKLDIGSMHLEFVTSDGHVPDAPLPGAGQPNPLCSDVPPKEKDGGQENVRSVGTLITFGKTRILDLGDLTWNKEIELLCPVNKVGKVDLYFVTGHGSFQQPADRRAGAGGGRDAERAHQGRRRGGHQDRGQLPRPGGLLASPLLRAVSGAQWRPQLHCQSGTSARPGLLDRHGHYAARRDHGNERPQSVQQDV